MRFAEDTQVSVAKSRAEIEDLIQRAGGTAFGTLSDTGRAVVVFELAQRRIMFELALPTVEQFESTLVRGRRRVNPPPVRTKLWEQACRSRWRALCLAIKAKLVTVESGIETLEEAFLPHIVVPHEGRAKRFAEVARAAIVEAYTGGQLPPLLGPG